MIRVADAGETILALILASPFYVILFSVIAIVVVWAFAAGLMALLGVVNFLTRPVQSILWLVKWVALIVASFGMLGGIVCLFFARYRIHGLGVCGVSLLLFLLAGACEMGREKLEDMRQERVARRQERREMRRQAKLDRISDAGRRNGQESRVGRAAVTGDGRPVVDTTAADLEQGYNE